RPRASVLEETEVMGYPDEPGWKASDTETSRAAARGVNGTVRGRVLLVYRSVDDATADEVAGRLSLSILAVRPRCSELKALGFLMDSGKRRRNRSGHRAVAWMIVRGKQPEMFHEPGNGRDCERGISQIQDEVPRASSPGD